MTKIGTPEISVVIPTYNRAHLISETIDSILGQSLSPSEIIVIDDGSEDNTKEVVKGFGSKVHYKEIRNSGVCVARNFGVQLARSEWIAFCDSDDIWLQDKLKWQLELINMYSQCNFCFTNFEILSNNSILGSKFDESPSGYWKTPGIDNDKFKVIDFFYDKLLVFNPIFPSTILIQKAFFCQIGAFNEFFSRKISEDFEFSLRCAQEGPVGVVSVPLVKVRKHEKNFSRGDDPEISFIDGDIDILKFAKTTHKLGRKHAAIINNEIVKRSECVANGAFLNGNVKLFRKAFHNIPLHKRKLKIWLKALIIAIKNIGNMKMFF